MDKGLLYLLLIFGAGWLITDEFFGKGLITKFVQNNVKAWDPSSLVPQGVKDAVNTLTPPNIPKTPSNPEGLPQHADTGNPISNAGNSIGDTITNSFRKMMGIGG